VGSFKALIFGVIFQTNPPDDEKFSEIFPRNPSILFNLFTNPIFLFSSLQQLRRVARYSFSIPQSLFPIQFLQKRTRKIRHLKIDGK
jgi:hypothetical protein